MLRLRTLVVGSIGVVATACTGGAYQTGMVVAGASFGEVREVVMDVAPALHLREDAATKGFFRAELAAERCGPVVVVIRADADEATIEVEQSCGPRWSEPKEYLPIAERLRQEVEARFGKQWVRGLASRFQSRG